MITSQRFNCLPYGIRIVGIKASVPSSIADGYIRT